MRWRAHLTISPGSVGDRPATPEDPRWDAHAADLVWDFTKPSLKPQTRTEPGETTGIGPRIPPLEVVNLQALRAHACLATTL